MVYREIYYNSLNCNDVQINAACKIVIVARKVLNTYKNVRCLRLSLLSFHVPFGDFFDVPILQAKCYTYVELLIPAAVLPEIHSEAPWYKIYWGTGQYKYQMKYFRAVLVKLIYHHTQVSCALNYFSLNLTLCGFIRLNHIRQDCNWMGC